MEYHIKLLEILYNEGFESLIKKFDELINNQSALINLIVMNMKHEKNVKLFCNYLKLDINKYINLVKNVLNSDLEENNKKIFLEEILNLENYDILEILSENDYNIMINTDLLLNVCNKINIDNWKNNVEYYKVLLKNLKNNKKKEFELWVDDIYEKYEYRCKSCAKNQELNDNILYILLELYFDESIYIDLNKYMDNSEDIDEISLYDIKEKDKDSLILLKLINITIYYSIDDLTRFSDKIIKSKNIIDKIENENSLLYDFDHIRNYIKTTNHSEITKYEKKNNELLNKINNNLMDNIYGFYIKILKSFSLNDIENENSIFYSNVLLNMLDYYIFYGKRRKYVYENIDEKVELVNYMCEVFMSNISNININIKLIDFYSEILFNEGVFIINRLNKIDYTVNVLNMIDKMKEFYIDLDSYDEYYKHEIKNKIISIFNSLYNPSLCISHYNKYTKKYSDNFFKFIINMNESCNICIENFIYYYKKNIYNLLTSQYYFYIKEMCIFYKKLLNNNIDDIDSSVINVAISKINKNMYDLSDLLKDNNNIYNILIFLIETLNILYEKGFIKNIKEDDFIDLDKKKILYEKLLKVCDNKNQLVSIEKFNTLLKTVENFEIEEEKEYDNIPEDYLDPIGNVLIKNPIILPSSNVVMEEEIIKKHLLYHNFDPFNRDNLDIKLLEEYNNKDEIKKRREVFIDDIEKWLKEN